MEDIDRIALALSLTANVTPGDWARLNETPRSIWESMVTSGGLAHLGAALGHAVGPVDWAAFDEQLARIEHCGARLLSRWDVAYPWRLRHVALPPPVLFVRGDVTVLAADALAIVGTRAPSAAGIALATRLARDVAAQQVVVVSGMARGIDTAAHRGALDAPAGRTVAVLGTGVDVPYPAENEPLLRAIAATGCVISEQRCGTNAVPHAFPKRNRIISGISEGVVVVEGGVKSGALITARWALAQGREVGAVPGFPGDFRSAGPNSLLKEGAFVIEDVRDVFANLPRLRRPCTTSAAASGTRHVADTLDAEARSVYDLVVRDADADDVARASGLNVGRVLEILARLEIDGWLARGDNGRFARVSVERE